MPVQQEITKRRESVSAQMGCTVSVSVTNGNNIVIESGPDGSHLLSVLGYKSARPNLAAFTAEAHRELLRQKLTQSTDNQLIRLHLFFKDSVGNALPARLQLFPATDADDSYWQGILFYDAGAADLLQPDHLVAQAKVGGWKFDLQHKTATLTRSLAQILEYDEGLTLTLKKALEIYRNEDQATVELLLHRLVEQGVPFDFDFEITTYKGTEKFVRVTADISAEEGQDSIIMGTLQDISDRKEYEMQLSRKSEFFRLIAQDSYHIYTINDGEGIIRVVSPSVTGILGYEPSDLTGRSSISLVHPNEREILIHRLGLLAEGQKELTSVKFRLRHKSGHYVWMEATAHNMLTHPVIAGILVTARDITEEQEAKRALEESERRYRSVVEHSPDAILVHRNKEILFANEQAKAFHSRFYGTLTDGPKLLGEGLNTEALERVNQRVRMMEENRDSGELTTYEFHNEDGDLFSLEAISVPITYHGEEAILSILRDISDRRRVEERLHLLDEAIEAINESVMITDADLDGGGPHIVYTNSSFEKLTGFSREDVRGKTPQVLELEGTDPSVFERQKRELARGHSMAGSTKTRRKDGTLLVMAWNVTPITDESGEITHFVSIQRDITDEIHAADRIRYMADILRSSTESIITTDLDGLITYWNPAAERLFGYKEAETLGKHISIIYPDEVSFVFDDFVTLLATGGEVKGQLMQRRHKTGDLIPVSMTISPIHDSDRNLIGISGFARDVRELRKAESDKRAYAFALRGIKDPVIILRLSEDGNKLLVDYVNRAFTAVTGFEQKELHHKLYELFGFNRRNLKHMIKLRDDMMASRTIRSEVAIRHKEGHEVWIDFNLSPLSETEAEENEGRYLAVLRDISDRKAYEQKLVQMVEHKNMLLSEINHRVKNNLQIISGLIEYKMLDGAEGEDHHLLRDVSNRIHTLALIHNRLHNRPDDHLVSLDSYLNDLIAHIKSSFSSEFDRITIRTEIAPIDLNVDKAINCGLVVNELLSNAIKYAFDGTKGTITVGFGTYGDDSFILSVSDNGRGLPNDYTINRESSLGLYMVKQVVEKQLKGRLAINKKDPTEFNIIFEENTAAQGKP